MNDAGAYEFLAARDQTGAAKWTRDFASSGPLVEWPGRIGHATITYDAPLGKYLMCVADGGNTISAYNSYILEADAVTGPYRMISFMERFGEQGYFLNIPSKFISADGRTMWLCYSANFTNHYLHRMAVGPARQRLCAVPPGDRVGRASVMERRRRHERFACGRMNHANEPQADLAE